MKNNTKKRRLTEENIRETIRLFNLGYSNNSISEKVNIHISTSSRITSEYLNPGKERRSSQLMKSVVRKVLKEEVDALIAGRTFSTEYIEGKKIADRSKREKRVEKIKFPEAHGNSRTTEKEIREIIFYFLNRKTTSEMIELNPSLHENKIKSIISPFKSGRKTHISRLQERVYNEIREEIKEGKSIDFIRDNYGYGSPVCKSQQYKSQQYNYYFFGLIKIKKK